LKRLLIGERSDRAIAAYTDDVRARMNGRSARSFPLCYGLPHLPGEQGRFAQERLADASRYHTKSAIARKMGRTMSDRFDLVLAAVCALTFGADVLTVTLAISAPRPMTSPVSRARRAYTDDPTRRWRADLDTEFGGTDPALAGC